MFKIILTIGTIQALAVFIQFIKSKFVAVYLGPAGVGVVGTIDQFVQLAAYASALSLPAASIKFLSKSHSEGHEAFKRNYAGFFKILLLLSVVGAFLAAGTIFLKPDLLGEEIEKYKLLLILGLLTLPTFTLTMLFTNVLAAAQKFKASSMLAVVTNAAALIASVIGIVAAGMFGLYLGNFFAGILLIVGVIIYFRENLGLPVYDRQTNVWKEIKQSPEISLLAMMLYFGAIAGSLAFLVARYLVLTNFGEVEAGLLHGVIALSLSVGVVLNPAINLYLSPIINRNIEKTIKVRQTIYFQRKIIFILSLASLPILMFPQLMLTIMFSAKFAAVGQIVYLFVMSQFILQLAGAHQALLISVDDVKIYTVITTAGQLIFAFACVLLIPFFGIRGVAFGLFIGNSFIFVLTLIRLILKHGFSVPLNIILLFGYTFATLFLAGFLGSQSAEWDTTVILAKMVFMFLFGGGLFLFLSKEEKAYIGVLRGRFFAEKPRHEL